ncbi:hypothetical protein CL621_00350 [archaeon]|nr:hypothetical protein [archaeon]
MVFDFFEKHSRLSWFIVVVGVVGIWIISSLIFLPSAFGIRFLPILYHILSFFLLTLFLLIALIKGEKKYYLFLIGILLAVGYGALDEIHQFFVPGRACTIFDVFLDGVGVVLASMVYMVRVLLKK